MIENVYKKNKFVLFLDILGFEKPWINCSNEAIRDFYTYLYERIKEASNITPCEEIWFGDSVYLLFDNMRYALICARNIMEMCIMRAEVVSSGIQINPFLLRGAISYGTIGYVIDSYNCGVMRTNHISSAFKDVFELAEKSHLKGAKIVISSKCIEQIDLLPQYKNNMEYDPHFDNKNGFEFLWPIKYLEQISEKKCTDVLADFAKYVDMHKDNEKAMKHYISTLDIMLKSLEKTDKKYVATSFYNDIRYKNIQYIIDNLRTSRNL